MKNTFSFRHDYGARNDPKIRKMISKLGPAAGWAWWVIVEELYEQGGRLPLDAVPELAYDAHVDESLVDSIIHDFGLFVVEKKEFYSSRATFELKDREVRSEAARRTANARWDREKGRGSNAEANADASNDSCKCNADAMRTQCGPNAKSKVKESKVNEEKRSEGSDAGASCGDAEGGGVLFPEVVVPNHKEQEIEPSKVVDLWNEIVEETKARLPRVKSMSEDRRKGISARLRAFKQVGEPMAVCEQLIRKACGSEFFRTSRWANFDWIFVAQNNWNKLYDGNYDDRPANKEGGYDRLHIPTRRPEDFEGKF